MKRALNKNRSRMNLSRLVMYLAIVAVFGFVNSFMIHNSLQREQEAESELNFIEFNNELVTFEKIDRMDLKEVSL